METTIQVKVIYCLGLSLGILFSSNIKAKTIKSTPQRISILQAKTDELNNVTKISSDIYAPPASPSEQSVVFVLHPSTGSYGDYGAIYNSMTAASMSHDGPMPFDFRIRNGAGYTDIPFIEVRPKDIAIDTQDRKIETWWFGYVHDAPANSIDKTRYAYNYTERKLDALYRWFFVNFPQASRTKVSLSGQSMGGWGSITYGLRRPQLYAAIFAYLPRWRQEKIPDLQLGINSDTNLKLSTGENFLQRMDMISYIKNPQNEIPFIAWAIGRQDGFASFESQIEAVAALRESKRGFTFSWNNGDHGGGVRAMDEVLKTYDPAQFELGKGYPVFLNSSLDQNPSVDLIGGINLGFRWRNLVETSNMFQVEVSNTLGAVTVDIIPSSKVFSDRSVQKVSIPAGGWKVVTFVK